MDEKQKKPYYDFSKASEISKCVRDLLKAYSGDTVKKPIVLEELRDIFSREELRKKILYGNEFCSVFKHKVGKRRLDHLRMFLLEIDRPRYEQANYQW